MVLFCQKKHTTTQPSKQPQHAVLLRNISIVSLASASLKKWDASAKRINTDEDYTNQPNFNGFPAVSRPASHAGLRCTDSEDRGTCITSGRRADPKAYWHTVLGW